MADDTPIRPISEWGNLAAKAKRNGCQSVAHFILGCLFAGIHIPPTAMKEVFAAWQRTK